MNANLFHVMLLLNLRIVFVVQDGDLVRLALHALYGVKSSLDEIDELFVLFSSNPADRTSNRVANVWSRSSSTMSVGHILKSTLYRSCGLFPLQVCALLSYPKSRKELCK